MNGLELLERGRRTFWANYVVYGESHAPLAADYVVTLIMGEEDFELPDDLQSRLKKATKDSQFREYANDLSPIRVSLPENANWVDYYKAARRVLPSVQKQAEGDNTDLIEAKAAAYLLIGLARRKYNPPRACLLCWRHARPGIKYFDKQIKYCDEHICNDENRAKHQQAKRVLERINQRWPDSSFSIRREAMISATLPEKGVLEDAILYRASEKPPKEYWRHIIHARLQDMPYLMDRFSKGDLDKIDRILSSAPKLDLLQDMSEWKKLVDILRARLEDKYCHGDYCNHSYNFDVWLDKIELANTWLEAECPTFMKVVKKKKQKLSDEEIARELGITPSAVSHALKRHKKYLDFPGFLPFRYASNAPQTAMARFRDRSTRRLPSGTPRPFLSKSRARRPSIKQS